MSLEVEAVHSLSEVDPEAWNALVAPGDPFTEHSFLWLLEQSRSVGPASSGWVPMHLLARRAGELVGALPLYLKLHSYGEFIFDFGWAQAAYRAGIAYYPKLVSAVPFTPVAGRRLLSRDDPARPQVVDALAEAARALVRSTQASSLHVLFCARDEVEALARCGLHGRLSTQYHFVNQSGLGSFDAFTACLRSGVRKNVRRERERAQGLGLSFSMRPFAELAEHDREAMWEFYNQTIDRYGSEPYLTHAFFQGLCRSPHAYAAMAHQDEAPIAGSLFFWKDQAMYGRYWGARRELPMLHFELCYYFPMAWGFERGMRRFEAGAQGEHKIRRGLLPRPCHSAHWAAHPGLDGAIADFVRREAEAVERDMAALAEASPYHR